MRAILTKFHGPTDFKGSRVSATDSDGNRVMISYDHALNSEECHQSAAVALVKKMGWEPVTLVGGSTRTGYAFVLLEGAEPYVVH